MSDDRRFIFDDDTTDGVPNHLYFKCPRHDRRCAVALRPHVQPNGHSWQWDGNREQPTLEPSIDCKGCWHGWIRQGEYVDA